MKVITFSLLLRAQTMMITLASSREDFELRACQWCWSQWSGNGDGWDMGAQTGRPGSILCAHVSRTGGEPRLFRRVRNHASLLDARHSRPVVRRRSRQCTSRGAATCPKPPVGSPVMPLRAEFAMPFRLSCEDGIDPESSACCQREC